MNHVEAARYHASRHYGSSFEQFEFAIDRIWRRHCILPYLGDDPVRRTMWDALMILAVIPAERQPHADAARLAERMLDETVEHARDMTVAVPGIRGYPDYHDALFVYLYRRTGMLRGHPQTVMQGLSAKVGMPTPQLRGRLEDVALLGQLSPRLAAKYVQGPASG